MQNSMKILAKLPLIQGLLTIEIIILSVLLQLSWTRVRTRTRGVWTRKYPDPGLKSYWVFGRSSHHYNGSEN